MLTSLIIAITSIAYLVGMLFTVRHTNLMQRTAILRGHPKKTVVHNWHCNMARTPYGEKKWASLYRHGCDKNCEDELRTIWTNEYGFIHSWIIGTTWPIVLGKKVIWVATKPIRYATKTSATSLSSWLHPEPEIPDQEKINQMHKELGIKD